MDEDVLILLCDYLYQLKITVLLTVLTQSNKSWTFRANLTKKRTYTEKTSISNARLAIAVGHLNFFPQKKITCKLYYKRKLRPLGKFTSSAMTL